MGCKPLIYKLENISIVPERTKDQDIWFSSKEQFLFVLPTSERYTHLKGIAEKTKIKCTIKMAGYKSQSLFWWKIMSEFVKFQEEIKSERGFHYQCV